MTTLADAIATPASINLNGTVGRQLAAISKSTAKCNEDAAKDDILVAAAQSTAPVPVALPGNWEAIPASTTQVMGGTGATGDYLSHVTIIPATTAAGIVQIKDGSGSAITIFAGGGTTALTTLIPFAVPLGLVSLAGAWSIITNANVSAIAAGKFT